MYKDIEHIEQLGEADPLSLQIAWSLDGRRLRREVLSVEVCKPGLQCFISDRVLAILSRIPDWAVLGGPSTTYTCRSLSGLLTTL